MTANDPQDTTQPAQADMTSTPDAAEPTLPDAPALNREQRRAQAKGKKGAPPALHPSNHANARTGGARPANASISNKIPRTGHK